MSYQYDIAYVFSIDDFAKVCKDAIKEDTKVLAEFQHMMNTFNREYFNKNGTDLICIYSMCYSNKNALSTVFMKKELLKYNSDFAIVGEDLDDFSYDNEAYGTLSVMLVQSKFEPEVSFRIIKLNDKEID